MALVTYILLSTLLAGLRGAFHPELLGYNTTLALLVLLLELLVIKSGTFLLSISSSSQLLDLLAYSGYKFVGVIISLLTSELLTHLGLGGRGGWAGWLIFLYCFSANAFFLLRSLRYVLLPDQGGQGGVGGGAAGYTVARSQKSRRTQFLFVYSYVVQFGFMLWLSRV
jgi:protein transport protein YIF1